MPAGYEEGHFVRRVPMPKRYRRVHAVNPPRTVMTMVVVLIALIGGCATAPPAPPTVNVTGIWRGTAAFVGAGAWDTEWRLEQRERTVTGESNTPGVGPRTIKGVVAGNVLTVEFLDSTKVQLVVSADEMTGTGTGRVGLRGTWTLRRQPQ
jgi:hypothetical protein